ncbi:MAG: uracil-DNA glycosylase family protein [Flavobacteriaceae bacterium]|nr:uracil-DNA glycosylase family protein [Flavobacteriaceae bacterium]MDH3796457.1 uracil-DNA glycosylase family protein [Flavobacteriaceae bacterium]
MKALLSEIGSCTICSEFLPLGPRPIVSAHPESRIAIIGQAPGTKVHETGIPWDDPSGDRLRNWLGVDKDAFYEVEKFALIPMGFCYPGKGKSGDLPPRPECAPQWHTNLLDPMKNLGLTILVGSYAQAYYLQKRKKKTLTETVRAWETYLPEFIPLPHPSGRNNIWLKKNSWFEATLVPALKAQVKKALS